MSCFVWPNRKHSVFNYRYIKHRKAAKTHIGEAAPRDLLIFFHCFAWRNQLIVSALVVRKQNLSFPRWPACRGKWAASVTVFCRTNRSALGLTSPPGGGTQGCASPVESSWLRDSSAAPSRLPEAPGGQREARPNIQPFIYCCRNTEAHSRDFTSATMWSTPHATSTTWPGTVTWWKAHTRLREDWVKAQIVLITLWFSSVLLTTLIDINKVNFLQHAFSF